ncbi:hypothetical protein QQ045_019249 [Rhodiola kirilowii]
MSIATDDFHPQVDNMNQAELDGMVMSTLETFDNPITDEYDRDEMEMLEELEAVDDNNVPKPKIYGIILVLTIHLASNFNTKVKNVTLKKTLSTAAHQNQLRKFVRHYGELTDELKNNTSALYWLEGIKKEKWCLAHDEGGRRWGSMTTNASESFNHALRAARDLPVCALTHETRKKSYKAPKKRDGPRKPRTDFKSKSLEML